LLKWQEYFDGNKASDVRVFDIAEKESINIVSCSPLFQGKVANLPFQNKNLDYLKHSSTKHLQLMRSFFSPALLSTLVGQTESEHIEQNLSLLQHPILTEKQWREILPVP
jgi:predicted aldo/keto reductase-like oxidoreductase